MTHISDDIARLVSRIEDSPRKWAPISGPYLDIKFSEREIDVLVKALQNTAALSGSVAVPAGAKFGISGAIAKLALDVHERRASPKVGPAGCDDDIRFLALSMAGEAGEAANVVKKSWRDGKPLNRTALAEEIAGTACYLVGLAAAIDIDLSAEMRKQMTLFEQRYDTPAAPKPER